MVQYLYVNQVYCFCIWLKLWIKSGFCLYTVNCSTFTQTSCYPQNSDNRFHKTQQLCKWQNQQRKLNYFLINYMPKYQIYSNTYEQTCIVTFIHKAVFVPAMFHFQNTICGANTANVKNCKVGQRVKLCSPVFPTLFYVTLFHNKKVLSICSSHLKHFPKIFSLPSMPAMVCKIAQLRIL